MGEQTCDAKLVGDCNDLDNSANFDKIPQGGSSSAKVTAAPAVVAASKVGQPGYYYSDTSNESKGSHQGVLRGRFTVKCNVFVWDVLNESGHPAGRMPDGRIPSASEWGNPSSKISGWTVADGPQMGEVMSNGHHVGIYAPLADGRPGSISAAASMHHAGLDGGVVHNDWGFRGDEGTIVFWKPAN